MIHDKTSRFYYLGCAADIAKEVVENGSSTGWMGDTETVRDLTILLARFNICYVDDMHGTWEYRAPKVPPTLKDIVEMEYEAIYEDLTEYDADASDEEDNTCVTDNLLEEIERRHKERMRA